jgi:acetolactate synthase-1/2/3 large subunit
LQPARYDAAVAALGAHGELVTRRAELAPALARAGASGLPACVNVMIEGLPAPTVARSAPGAVH